MDKLRIVEQELLSQLKKDYPEFQQGDVIKVFHKIVDKDKERTHMLEGVVIKIGGAMHRKSFILRRTSYGQAYEVLFPYYSPTIEKIELVRKSRKSPRRSRLFYLRERSGKKAMVT